MVSDIILLQQFEQGAGSVVVDAMFEMEKLFHTVLLVVPLIVVGLLLSSCHSLNALLEVVLERVAHTLGSSLAHRRVDILGLLLIVVVVVLIFFLLGVFFFFNVL